jgi:hypothetical protein
MVRFECYCPRLNGKHDPGAIVVTFATKTPFAVWFDEDHPVAFRFGDRLVVCSNGTQRRLRSIDGLPPRNDSRLDLSAFNHELETVVRRLFEPPDLDVDTPPFIVADWLQDRGLDSAAARVRETTAPGTNS